MVTLGFEMTEYYLGNTPEKAPVGEKTENSENFASRAPDHPHPWP